jgi:sugar lactone lactonase YvrE
MNTKRDASNASLYCLEPSGKLRKVFSNVMVSNGLGWSPDNKTMYYIDSPTRKVVAFDYNLGSGEISNKLVVVDFAGNELGNPDGMAVDAEGMLWIAHWGGAAVSRWNPSTKKRLEIIQLPAEHTSSCCFGGRNLDELYVTSAREGLDERELKHHPESGGIFRIKTGVRGMPANQFADARA